MFGDVDNYYIHVYIHAAGGGGGKEKRKRKKKHLLQSTDSVVAGLPSMISRLKLSAFLKAGFSA